MARYPLLTAAILFFAVADLMLAFPQIDLAVSDLCWSPERGFLGRGQAWEQLAYHSLGPLLTGVTLGLIGLQALGRRLWWRPEIGQRSLALLLLLALVPGLLVNLGLKEHWGRERPVQLERFGGTKTFTPAFVPSDQGGRSFSSGHVAAAAWLVAVAAALFGLGAPWTRLAALYALLVALARIAAGGHFLSDVLTSMLLVWMGYLLLKYLLLVKPKPAGASPGVGAPA